MISENIDAYTADLSVRHRNVADIDNESSDSDEESDSEVGG